MATKKPSSSAGEYIARNDAGAVRAFVRFFQGKSG
jgi:hypothetical protein